MCIFDFLKQNILFMAKFVKIIHLSLFGRQFFWPLSYTQIFTFSPITQSHGLYTADY